MLKQRVLTAIPLAVLVVWGIITQPEEIVLYALLTVMLISGWEWARLSGIQNTPLRLVYAVVICAVSYFAEQTLGENLNVLMGLLSFTVLAWCVAIFHMFSKGPQAANPSLSFFKLFIGFIALIPPVLGLMLVRSEGAWWLFYCLSIVWMADIGAYFSGKRFGKHKLAVKLSPGKTKEGLYGAIVLTAIYSVLAGLLFNLKIGALLGLLIVTIFATFMSVAGDLFVSLLKREKDLKDTGNILPGHGGMLDRIDSVLSSAPFLALFLNWVVFNA